MGIWVWIISTEPSRPVSPGRRRGKSGRGVAGVLIRRRPSRYDCARFRGRQNPNPD